jgi:glycyl-tRNA synthetase
LFAHINSCFQVDEIAAELMETDISTRVDKSGAALGRRYARADELGIPFAVTVDFETLTNGTVTLRERDSTRQVRLPKSEVTPSIFAIVHNRLTWEKLKEKYPVVVVDDGESAPAEEGNANATTVVENTGRGRFSRPAPSK